MVTFSIYLLKIINKPSHAIIDMHKNILQKNEVGSGVRRSDRVKQM